MPYVANHALKQRIEDLHTGLHAAMTALITDKDQAKAEVILRQMDDHLATTRRQMSTR